MNSLAALPGAWRITRRELRDQVKDWRILTPIIILTLFFPLLMNFTAQRAVAFVQDFGADIVAERLIPFLLMIVGFFPISVSLVIALESFAGERERLTLEPLLASPMSDTELYLGKMLASVFMPLTAAYLGITFYLVGLYFTIGWTPPPTLLVQVVVLTGAQAVVMVSGAVVVSSQTTSVRAANLLASFIIIPMSQLIIGESLIMFWGRYNILWWIVVALLVIAAILGRMGLHLFNREEMLGRDIDLLDLRWAWTVFRQAFVNGARTPLEWLRDVLTHSVPRLARGSLVMGLALVAAYLIGTHYGKVFQLPADLFDLDRLDGSLASQFSSFGFFSGAGVLRVLWNNVRAVALATFLGVFTFGVMSVILFMAPVAIIGYFAANTGLAGIELGPFLLGFVVPHGLLEVPAAILAGAAILELGMSLMRPDANASLGRRWLGALAEWARVGAAVIVPLLIGAAAIEVFVTPRVALAMLAGG